LWLDAARLRHPNGRVRYFNLREAARFGPDSNLTPKGVDNAARQWTAVHRMPNKWTGVDVSRRSV